MLETEAKTVDKLSIVWPVPFDWRELQTLCKHATSVTYCCFWHGKTIMSHVPPPTPTFEKDRIRALKNERINSQKKTFTKWVNSFLDKVSALHVSLQEFN